MRTEKEIFKDFEEIGYTDIRFERGFIYKSYLVMKKPSDKCLFINLIDQTFELYEDMWGDFVSKPISLKEHKLLHELFECWGWIEC